MVLAVISVLFFGFIPSEPDLHYLIKTEQFSLSVEKKLYKKPKSDTLYVHFILKNVSDKAIGFDLKQPDLISTHLSSLCDEPQRTKIREMRSKYWGDTLSDQNKMDLYSRFTERSITRIEPGEEFSYYKDITLPKKYYKGKHGYLIVTCDGELIVANAVVVKEYSLYDPDHNAELRDVVMKKPVTVEELPKNITVIQ